jgi:CD2 antigen cytoplasmic tail-binding protein 2
MSGRRPAPRPNRAGEAFARTRHLDAGDGPPSSKKPRFDVRNPSALAPDGPEEDAILELDEIGKGGQRTKRNAVNLDGYNSDSSNEGFDARAEARATQAKKSGNGRVEAEDSDDMFADPEEDLRDDDEDREGTTAGTKKKKDVRFLDEEEIVGQVAGSKSGGHVSANFSLSSSGKSKEVYSSSSEDEGPVEEEIDEEIGAGGLKKHAPKLDAFNMKSEMEEGRFDAQGNFVRKAQDPDAVHDSWLDGVSKKDMKRASEAAKKREDERRRKTLEDDRLVTADVLKALIIRLEKGETVLEALARLGKGKEKKKKPKWHSKNRSHRKDADNMDIDVEKDPEDPAETRRRAAVEAITGAADTLLTRGQSEIYEATRETLTRQYRRETGDDWTEPRKEAPDREDADGDATGAPETKHWEYKWTDGRDGGETYGPYEGAAMEAWLNAGFFGEGVEFRRVGMGGASWSRVADFL